jgi:hypothetical protein
MCCEVLIVFHRVSLVDQAHDLAQLASAEDRREWPQATLGISTQVRQFFTSIKFPSD